MRRLLTLMTFLAAAFLHLSAAPRPIPAFQPMCDSLTSYLSQRRGECRLHKAKNVCCPSANDDDALFSLLLGEG